MQRLPDLASLADSFPSRHSAVGQVELGRALLVTCVTIVAATIWSLNPAPSEGRLLVVIGILMLAIVGLSPYLAWSNQPSRLPLIFPLCVLAALTGLGIADNGAATAYTGLIVLCFVYIGLTQPSGTSVLIVPLAAGRMDRGSGLLVGRYRDPAHDRGDHLARRGGTAVGPKRSCREGPAHPVDACQH